MFQDRFSPLMEQLIFFHDHALMILIIIISLISYVIFMLVVADIVRLGLVGGQEIEVIWTVFPAVVLIFIALPSLRLLYLLDEVGFPAMTLRVVGHQ